MMGDPDTEMNTEADRLREMLDGMDRAHLYLALSHIAHDALDFRSLARNERWYDGKPLGKAEASMLRTVAHVTLRTVEKYSTEA